MANKEQLGIDTFKVIGAAAGATGITLANINVALTTISVSLAICYTIWKWRKDYKKND